MEGYTSNKNFGEIVIHANSVERILAPRHLRLRFLFGVEDLCSTVLVGYFELYHAPIIPHAA